MKIINRKFITAATLALGVAALATFSPEALAVTPTAAPTTAIALSGSGQSLGTISANITNSLQGAGTLVIALSYLGALAFGFMGALKWKAYGEQPDRTPLKVPVTYMAIAAILAALPEFLGTGISTIWGSSAETVVQP